MIADLIRVSDEASVHHHGHGQTGQALGAAEDVCDAVPGEGTGVLGAGTAPQIHHLDPPDIHT